ncbi:MAG: LuxR C-terminal-related transcriptional regulator [Tannerella sp.]|jgi:DNA-binding CsgD family transcriptional regulator|nr:LuxR C-terminal-related transcriptional regulator [Tannerella sp.]
MKPNIVSTLNEKLLKQPFSKNGDETVMLAKYQQLAAGYAKIENSIAVLSDMKSNKSYLYNGGIAEKLGFAERGSTKNINSIWEEEIFDRIHPDDLMNKYLLELQFFQLLETLPVKERSDYYAVNKMRMKNSFGEYITIRHRIFYVCNRPLGNLWLTLCFYDCSFGEPEHEAGIIVNSATGDVIKFSRENSSSLLSKREKEILLLIEKGEMSKDIADTLFISIHTVNRHRQNILEKLRVKNSIEACRVAKLMRLFS